MLFFLNLDGTVTRSDTDHVYQGQNKVANVELFTLISPAQAAIQVAFTLPNGLTTTYAPMSYVGAYSVDESNQKQVHHWKLAVPYNVTEVEGQVGVSFNVLLNDGTSGETLETINQTTYTSSFTVEYSALPIPPTTATESELEQLLDLLNLYYAQNTSLAAKQPFVVGTVNTNTLNANQQASVAVEQSTTPDGNGNYPTNFDFGIPQGTTFTPSVDDNGNISWENDGGKANPVTKNIKGAQGQTGATPDIEMQATVDANVGTPSVAVEKSGTAENPKFTLAFSNIKGETGADGNHITISEFNHKFISLEIIEVGGTYRDVNDWFFVLGTYTGDDNKTYQQLAGCKVIEKGSTTSKARVMSILDLPLPKDGTDGKDGAQGVGVKSITSGAPTVVNNKTNTPITITLTDNTTIDLVISAENGKDGSGDVVQETGQSESAVMSQKAVTDELAKKATTTEVNAKYTKPSGGIPKTDLSQGVQDSLDKADTALQSAPVTSVNGKTGDVQLAAEDVGALPSSTKFVSSVNGQSGAVTGLATTTEVNAKYTKPESGIPKSDLADDVKTSLGKADTAVQSGDLSVYAKKAELATVAISGSYDDLANIPVINQDLTASGFTPVANTYYRHTGATTDTFTKGVIYLYDTAYHKLGENGGTTLNKYSYRGNNTAASISRLCRIIQNAKKVTIMNSSYDSQVVFAIGEWDNNNNIYLTGTYTTIQNVMTLIVQLKLNKSTGAIEGTVVTINKSTDGSDAIHMRKDTYNYNIFAPICVYYNDTEIT